jgi:hypothetical protein
MVDGLGALVDEILFTSGPAHWNSDGLTYVVSGSTEDGSGLRMGFEDMLGLRDQDFQDLTFTVSLLDDGLL